MHFLHSYSFADYGVMLEIQDVSLLSDGRSLVQSVGGRRFKVKIWICRKLFPWVHRCARDLTLFYLNNISELYIYIWNANSQS